ncbi:MBL fold metallo-hydrolase [Arthrobacter sp. zg-Y820]|uniref:MBL fold metallo-hydrolase n=1 Tax=unclassified Arthrobacter TaxID=235627 RepID=UPI001E3B5F5A|nr:MULTISPECIES: MBL fold metallo-hydrolase [unclassified Arthrobacter]MCC9195634.1 MBL fold metallo-hydrolase [Arthrobacter sp. zg-Y820]MDK1278493.1 MBL fold metallo-hydrolase [Arthrobacter sp. zg.Y820]MDK1359902.1 MBL fold metallo-hydrolase [Arthrobacter sp. zg-Y1219]WIB09071.1 MBL fold metallo-hydrolase [Arthrobacter sp. zg-Y820]
MTDATGQKTATWREVAPRVLVRTNPGFGMNTGLVIGDERALIIDTGAGPRQGAAILEAVREHTDLPLTVVNTHAHFDHCFGNAILAASGVEDIWATSSCAAAISEHGDSQRSAVAALEPEMAAGSGAHTAILAPNRLVDGAPVDLDLGGISVTLFHLGRGHTDHDLLVGAGDVLFTGDLVEEGADPSFEDSFPKEWIRTLGKMAALDDLYSLFVPGHGAPVTVDFVTTQMNKMRAAVTVTRSAMEQASTDMTKAIPILPYGPEQSRSLLMRLRTLARWKWLK